MMNYRTNFRENMLNLRGCYCDCSIQNSRALQKYSEQAGIFENLSGLSLEIEEGKTRVKIISTSILIV